MTRKKGAVQQKNGLKVEQADFGFCVGGVGGVFVMGNVTSYLREGLLPTP